jgi:hypothetical protein
MTAFLTHHFCAVHYKNEIGSFACFQRPTLLWPLQQQPSAFGAAAFGSTAAPAATGGGLFGSPSTNLFGATSQPATSTTGFGGFGATAGTSS